MLDADIYGPSQPTLLGTSERPKAKDKQLIPVAAQGVGFAAVLVAPLAGLVQGAAQSVHGFGARAPPRRQFGDQRVVIN